MSTALSSSSGEALEPGRRSAASTLTFFTCAGLILMSGLLQWIAWRDKCATFDEPTHLVASYLQTQDGGFRVDPENPPLWRYYVAFGMPRLSLDKSSELWKALLQSRAAEGTFVRETLYSTAANNPDSLMKAARFRMMLLGSLLACVTGWWAWRLGGNLAAIVAVWGLCFDPNFIAHAPLVKNDVATALCLTLMMVFVWLVGQRATLLRLTALALLAAAAINVKFTGIIAIPIVGLLLFYRALLKRPWCAFSRSINTRRGRIGLVLILLIWVLLISWGSIWACYQFRFSPADGQHIALQDILRTQAKGDWIVEHGGSPPLPGEMDDIVTHWRPRLAQRLVLSALRHHVFPEAFLVGWLHLSGLSETRLMFLAGIPSYLGWWYYFPVAILFKTPLATLVAFALGTIFVAFGGCRRWGDPWALRVILIATGIYFVAAMASHVNVGIRHLLPVYPFLFILLGLAAAQATRKFQIASRWILLLLAAGLTIETCAAFPDFIPCLNVAAGGWQQGINLLGDSNIDWGEDLPALAQWQRDHRGRQIYLCYFGTADPRYYHIRYINLPGSFAPPDEREPSKMDAVLAISAARLRDPLVPTAQRELFDYLRRRPPLAVLGHTIYVYPAP